MPPPTDRRRRAGDRWGGIAVVNSDRGSAEDRGDSPPLRRGFFPGLANEDIHCSGSATVRLSFEWDEEKAGENYRKHKVSFDEGVTVFNDPFSITIGDPDHSANEQRYVDIDASDRGRVLVVSYTERGRSIRLISCRKATRRERRQYEEGID